VGQINTVRLLQSLQSNFSFVADYGYLLLANASASHAITQNQLTSASPGPGSGFSHIPLGRSSPKERHAIHFRKFTSIQQCLLPPVTSLRGLCDNIVHLLHYRRPGPSLTAVIEYHDQHPSFQSTRSYNILLSRAVQTANFGIAHMLLKVMRNAELPANMETRKLYARLLVRQNRWEDAWFYVKQSMREPGGDSGRPSRTLYQLWLELLGPSRTTQRKHSLPWRLNSSSHLFAVSRLKKSTTQSFTHRDARRAQYVSAQMSGLQTGAVSPHEIWIYTFACFQVGQPETAKALAGTFLANLPRHINARRQIQILEIIHLVMVRGSTGVASGLKRLQYMRQLMSSLLTLHPSLKPSPRTLLILLRNIQTSRRASQYAHKVSSLFTARWGVQMQDESVYRFLALLSLKQRKDGSLKNLIRRRKSQFQHDTVGFSSSDWPPRHGRYPPPRACAHWNQRQSWWFRRLRARRIRMRIILGAQKPLDVHSR
jgi:hypothetical protein